MKLDIRVKDDFEQQGLCVHARITLDGIAQTGALMADEEAGEVLRFKKGPDGKLVWQEKGKDAETELVKGVVVISFPDRSKT